MISIENLTGALNPVGFSLFRTNSTSNAEKSKPQTIDGAAFDGKSGYQRNLERVAP